MEAIKERFEKILDRIETSGKSATEWFGKYTHELFCLLYTSDAADD